MPLYLTELCAYGEKELSLLLPMLPPLRRAAAEKARTREARQTRIVGYALLVYAARRLLPDACLGELIIGERGKPRLPDPRLTFSLSHTAHGVALAIGESGGELGVDLEAVRPLRPSLLARFASDAELDALRSAKDFDEAATQLWTKKEAETKRSGYGIGQDLRLVPTHRTATCMLMLGGVRHALSLAPAQEVPPVCRVAPEELISLVLNAEKQTNKI